MKNFINKMLIITLLLLFSCGDTKKVLLSNLKTEKGITYYQDAFFSGEAYDIYKDGSYKVLVRYKNGKKNGNLIQWFPNKGIKEKGKYSKGKKKGIHVGLWPDGSTRFEKLYDSNGLMDGKQNQWHSNGVLSRSSNYKEGRESGEQKGWRENGDLRYNYQIVNNKRYGYMGSKVCVPPV